jgi:hypothetical protein
MPEDFFEPGRRSRCLFTPDLWCERFDYQLPSAPVEFFCEIAPQTVAVVLPGANAEEIKEWDPVYQQIARAWGDRRVGFQCYRVGADAWTSPRPCDDCALVRNAQIVVIDLSHGSQRADVFREMAVASANAVKMMRSASPPPVSIPLKKVILISRGDANILPHYKRAFDYIDYANPQGQTDLTLLHQKMLELALSAGLFEEGIIDLSIEFGDASLSEAVKLEDEDQKIENLIRLIEEPEASAIYEAPVQQATPVSYFRSEELDRILQDSGVPELIKRAEKSVLGLDPNLQLVVKAESEIKQGRYVEAIRLFHQWTAEDSDWQRFKEGRIRACLDNLSIYDVVDIFLEVASPKGRLSPSRWRDVNARTHHNG